MDEKIDHILALSDQCTVMATQLIVCLETERNCLVQFKTEDLLQNNSLKDELLLALQKKKAELREEIRKQFGSRENLEGRNDERGHRWRKARAEWLRTWEQLKVYCETNQGFLAHSLKNLDLMTENLKRLFHQQSLYNAKGSRVEAKAQGTVVQASY